jgi:hypothetical protein
MGLFTQHSFTVKTSPPLLHGTTVAVKVDSERLQMEGMNLPVEISTAAVFRKPGGKVFSALAMAHLDTVAGRTYIDIGLAEYLTLTPTGSSESKTASGVQTMPDFVIDLSLRTPLSPFLNLRIGSCKLGFNLQQCLANPNDPRNISILIGRDVMSKWNIVWNGPTSTVFISD